MAAFRETATERLLRQERERAKLLSGLPASAVPKKSVVETALEEAYRPIREQQRLLNMVDPLRHAFNDPVLEQIKAITRASKNGFNADQSGAGGSALLSTPAPTKPQSRITSAADLGPLVRKARKALKLSQGEFAAHAGVGRRFVSELEAGKPSMEFDKVIACAAAAGINIFARPRRD